MSLYYFNIKDGSTTLDDEGHELADLSAARREAVETAGRILADSEDHLWNGEPWCMWVTDQPSGGGTTLFTLEFTAKDGGKPPATRPA
jgi:hypothetical protein